MASFMSVIRSFSSFILTNTPQLVKKGLVGFYYDVNPAWIVTINLFSFNS